MLLIRERESKTMKPTETLTGLQILLSALMIMLPHLASAATADVTVEGVVTVPSCTLSGPASHNLGIIAPGIKQEKAPYILKVNCSTDRAYLLYGETINAAFAGRDWVAMNVGGQVPDIGQQTTLKLLVDRTAIRLDGTGSTDEESTFCSGATTQNCMLVPEVDVPVGALRGNVSAVLRFSLRHL